jgi:phosphomannomutase
VVATMTAEDNLESVQARAQAEMDTFILAHQASLPQ